MSKFDIKMPSFDDIKIGGTLGDLGEEAKKQLKKLDIKDIKGLGDILENAHPEIKVLKNILDECQTELEKHDISFESFTEWTLKGYTAGVGYWAYQMHQTQGMFDIPAPRVIGQFMLNEYKQFAPAAVPVGGPCTVLVSTGIILVATMFKINNEKYTEVADQLIVVAPALGAAVCQMA